jgi:hypothetical protein
MDGRWFDVDVSDPFLFVCQIKKRIGPSVYQSNKKHADTIVIREKIAVNHFHLFRSFDWKESAQFMSHSLQIKTWRWHLTNVNDFTRPVCWILIDFILFVFWNFYLFYHSTFWSKPQRPISCCSIPSSSRPNFLLQFLNCLKFLNNFIRIWNL